MAVHTKHLSHQSQQTTLEQVDKSRSITAPTQDPEEQAGVADMETSTDHKVGDTAILEARGDPRSISVRFSRFRLMLSHDQLITLSF